MTSDDLANLRRQLQANVPPDQLMAIHELGTIACSGFICTAGELLAALREPDLQELEDDE